MAVAIPQLFGRGMTDILTGGSENYPLCSGDLAAAQSPMTAVAMTRMDLAIIISSLAQLIEGALRPSL